MTASVILQVQHLHLDAPGGRPLFRDLTLCLDRGDKVAIVGRNGVGKSSLLGVLAGDCAATSGEVSCHGERLFVPQGLPPSAAESPGELRRRQLQDALRAEPDLLLLDEPTQDLDREANAWLVHALRAWPRALLVVTHDRRLLREFRHFFVVSESGCRYFAGDSQALLGALAREQDEHEQRYVSQLAQLLRDEQHRDRVMRRMERTKNVGRIRELARATPRIRLNMKRGQAQVNRAKRQAILDDRIDATRAWVQAARRSLAVELPLSAALPQLPKDCSTPVAQLERVSARAGERVLFDARSLTLYRQRLALTGANGAGKSTLIELIAGTRAAHSGSVRADPARMGYVAQNSANWQRDESLLQLLVEELGLTIAAAASCIRVHRFPFALAQRPLASLSPGERLRAALICMLQRETPPEVLVLDEPTSHLDFLGHDALQRLLAAWPGGLVIASHDQEFLDSIGITGELVLGDRPDAQSCAPAFQSSAQNSRDCRS